MPRVFVKTAFHNIKFKCRRCGSCCHHKRPEEFGDLVPLERLKEFWQKSNLIYLTHQEVEAIRRETGLEPAQFVDTLFEYDEKTVHIDDAGERIILDFPVMKRKEDTTCIFFHDGCTIYPLRPKACRLFPFRVEEETNDQGDITLNICYNESCPGMGMGKIADKALLQRLVLDQFKERSESVASEVRALAEEGRIGKNARIYRSHPARRDKSGSMP